MFVEVFKNNGTDYLRLVSSKRVANDKGVKVARKHVELNIGPLKKFDDGQPDYLPRLRESFKAGTPLIDTLLPFVSPPSETPKQYTFTFTEGNEECVGQPKYFAQSLFEKVFSELGLTSLLATLKHQSKITFDLQGFVKLLTFSRILDPASKMATILQNDDYYQPYLKDENSYHVYDTLDILHENKEKMIQRINHSVTKGLERNPQMVFYDVTNFFFEIDEPDDDFEVNGELVKGLRKKGVSKENRKQPIVQMGLFMDDMGIPITMEMFPGNTLDQATLRPALKKSLNQLGFSRFILVADRGMCSYKNICHLLDSEHGYIVSKSIKKTEKTERNWMLDPEGFQYKGQDFRYKSRIITRKVVDEAGVKREIKEQVVVYWSKKFYDREYYQHASFLEFIQKLKENPASFRVTATQAKSLKKFFKRDVVNQETGELLDAKKLLTMIDDKKLEEYTAYMGYYQLVTSELDMSPLEVIDKYHGLSQIEDQFRVMKGDLETRPVYVRTPEHIEAHLLICLIALIILRIIQRRVTLSERSEEEATHFWTYGMSCEKVQKALQKWTIEAFPDEYYRFNNMNNPDLQRILKAFKLEIPYRFFSRGDLKKIKTHISVFP